MTTENTATSTMIDESLHDHIVSNRTARIIDETFLAQATLDELGVRIALEPTFFGLRKIRNELIERTESLSRKRHATDADHDRAACLQDRIEALIDLTDVCEFRLEERACHRASLRAQSRRLDEATGELQAIVKRMLA